MKEEKEDFIVIRIVIVAITMFIATVTIMLFGLIVVNAQVNSASISAYEIDGPNINWQIVNGLPQSPSGGIDYLGLQLAQGYNGTPSPVFTSGHSYDIEVIINGSNWSASSTNVSINKGIYFQNGGGNWIQATPDSQTNWRWGPNTDGTFYADWHFTLDATQNCTNFLVNFAAQNFKIGTWSRGEIIITDLTSGDSAIISSINSQTDQIKENNDSNTNKIIQDMLPGIQNIENINGKLSGETNIEQSKQGQVDSTLEGVENSKSNLIGLFKPNNYDSVTLFDVDENAWELVWDLVDDIINIDLKIKAMILSILALGIINQVLRRNNQ